MTDDNEIEETPTRSLAEIQRELIKGMTGPDISAAVREGKFDALMGRPERVPAEGQLDRSHLKRMTAAEIVTAKKAGRFDNLMNRN